MLTSAHNRKKAEYFWASVKWFPLKTVFFTSSVKYSLCITHHRTLRRDTCIFSTKHFTAKRTACCWHNQLSSGKVPMPGGRIISFPSRSRQTSVRQPFLRRILLKRKHPVRNCPTALAYQPRSLMLKAKSFVPFMWPAMPVVNSAREVQGVVKHCQAWVFRLNSSLYSTEYRPLPLSCGQTLMAVEFWPGILIFLHPMSKWRKKNSTNITEHPRLLHSVPVRKGADIFHKRLPSGPLPHPCCVHWRHSWPALPALPQASIYMHYAGKTQPLQLQRQAKVFNERFFAAQPFCVACHSEITRALKHRRHT